MANANPNINYKVRFKHGEGSRVSNIILKALKSNKTDFKLEKIKTPTHLRSNEDHVQETIISFLDKEKPAKLEFVRNEIIALIPEFFPVNYFFKFTDAFSALPFNYKLEFCLIVHETGQRVCCYTRIKEQKKQSEPITAYKIEVD